jgi:hypothetical protein
LPHSTGKTTTILHVARDMPHMQITCLTYNRRLKDVTQSKASSLGLTNLKVLLLAIGTHPARGRPYPVCS